MAWFRFTPFVFALLLPAVVLAAPAPTFQDANQAFKQGQNQAALDKVNAYLSAHPKDAQGRFLKGLILTELNRLNDAIKIFSDLAEDYPDLPEPHNNLAVLYAAQGQYERAKNSLEMAIRTHPSYATAHENLGDIYAKLASQAYDKALQLDKSNRSAQTKLSMVKELLGPTRIADGGKSKLPAKPRTAPLTSEPTPAMAVVAASEKPTVPPASGKSPGEVEKRIQAWAKAWSSRDADAYLAFYAENFNTGGKDRAAWSEERRVRVTRPKRIEVGISEMTVEIQGNRAEARFNQRYESNLYKDSTSKTLILEKQGSDWKIVEER